MPGISETIKKRRSIYPKMYSGKTIDDVLILQLLENANWAPTHKLTEPWRFTIFSGEGLKKLADFQARLYQKVTTEKGTFEEIKFNKLKERPLLCSHIIGIGVKHSSLVPKVEEINAVACAVQNMMLTATELGIGCYWGSGGITYFQEARAFFGLEATDDFLGFLYLGDFEGKLPKGNRKSFENKITWIKE